MASSVQIDGKVSVGCPSCEEGWKRCKSFQFHIHDFANLSTTKDHYIASPEFTCNGHQWELELYPGGGENAAEGKVSVYLSHLSEGAIDIRFDINVIDKFGKLSTGEDFILTKHEFTTGYEDGTSCGFPNLISRTKILDESKNILDDNGTLTVVVSIEEESTDVFVPKNPFLKVMQGTFNDEATSDVCFEVITAGEKDDDDGNKRAKTTTPFYAHHNILRVCAPMLATICESNDERSGVVTAPVNDIKPKIFHHLLSYVYGRTIPKDELKTHAKDIIDAADKYSIVNLKLAAEAAYVDSTNISLDNAIDNLLYADSMNLALLKEAVMDFLADNHNEAIANMSFTDFPGHVVKDLLVAVSRNSKKNISRTKEDELNTLCVSALRRKLDEKGLEVDGSREAMIESIKSHSEGAE